MNQPAEETNVETAEEQGAVSDGSSKVDLAVRLLLPLLLLGAGLASYAWFSREPPSADRPRPKPKPIEVRVEELKREDFLVHVTTHGIMESHGQGSLTTQIGGRVQTIHPGLEVGAFFKEGEVMLEIDPVDFEEALINAKAQLAQADFNLEFETVRAEQARLSWEDLAYNEEPSDLVLRIPHVRLAERQQEQAKARLLSAERALERTQVKAPFDGRVLTRTVGVGQTISAGMSLGIIFPTDYSEVRLPVSTRFLADVTLPEDLTDPPVEIVLKDGLAEQSDVEWSAQILRTEGALDASTLELFAVARVEDPFGLQTKKTPLRIGQPVSSEIPGRTLDDVFVIPRESVSNLKRIRLVDPDNLTLKTANITKLWENNDFLVFRDEAIPDGTLLVLDRLVYAPDGGKVVVVDDEVIDDLDMGLDSEQAEGGKAEK